MTLAPAIINSELLRVVGLDERNGPTFDGAGAKFGGDRVRGLGKLAASPVITKARYREQVSSGGLLGRRPDVHFLVAEHPPRRHGCVFCSERVARTRRVRVLQPETADDAWGVGPEYILTIVLERAAEALARVAGRLTPALLPGLPPRRGHSQAPRTPPSEARTCQVPFTDWVESRSA